MLVLRRTDLAVILNTNITIKMREFNYSIKENIAYTNGLLHSMELLNDAPNSAKDYGIVELNNTSEDLTESLRSFLETPNWNFNFIKLNQDWKKIILKDTSWAFTEIITQNYGYATEIGAEKYEALVENFNIKIVQKIILDNIERLLNSFNSFEIFRIEIGWIEPNDSSGYFAHGESNYLFKATEKNMFFLYFRASD